MARKKKAPDREDVLLQAAQLARAGANDCAVLALQGKDADIGGLDLRLLTGVKKNKDGSVEVKLADRLQILRFLMEMTEHPADSGSGETSLLEMLHAQTDA